MKSRKTISFVLIILLLLKIIQASAQNIPDFLVNEQGSPDGSEQSNPCIRGDGTGNYVVTWQDERSGNNSDIFAQIYTDGGTIQGANFKVNDDEGTAPQYRPYVATGAQMDFVIVWLDKRESNEWDIFAQRYSGEGLPIGPNFKVNDDTSDIEQEHPSVAVDSLGNFVVVWADERNGNFDVYAQRYSGEGVAIGINFKVNDDTGDALQYWPNCATAKDGSLVVTWVDKRINDDYNIFAQRFTSDGSLSGINFQVNTDTGTPFHLRPVAAMDEAGGFIIAWEDNRNSEWDIYIQRFQNNGNPIGDNFILEGNPLGSGQRNSSISGDPDGNFIISWEDDRNDYADVYARRYSYNGNAIGECFKVNDDTSSQYQGNARVCMDDDGDFRIAWQDHRMGLNGDIFAQAYLHDGTAVADNLKVNDDAGSENQFAPSMAVDGNGTMIFVWVDERNVDSYIYGQRFSADGSALGSNFNVIDDTGIENYTLQPSVAASEAGDFVIAWADFRNGYCFEIYAQRFAADGTPQGNNFQVSNSGACMHYNPVVSFKENDNFIIVWSDSDEGGFGQKGSPSLIENENEKFLKSYQSKGNEPDIFAQIYLYDGTPFGENFMVNEEPGNTFQTYPAIAVDPNGNFMITWQDDRNGPWHIYLQRFQYDGTPIGINFPVEDNIYPDHQNIPSISVDGEGDFSVAWMDRRNGNYDIFCRRFLNDGSPLGESFQLNDDSGSAYQSLPRVCVQSDGRFVSSWTDNRNGTYDVFARRFWSNGEPYSDNFMIPNTDALEQSCQGLMLDNNLIYSTWQDNREGQTGYDIRANVLEWDVGVGTEAELLSGQPDGFDLSQNFPNPFKKSTSISFYLDEAGTVRLNIYDLRGKLIRWENYKFQVAGIHRLEITGSDMSGGFYLYQVVSGGNMSATKKMVLLN